MSVDRWSKYVINLVHVLFCFLQILGPNFRPLFFLLFHQINYWGHVFRSHFLLSRCSGYEPKEGGKLSLATPKTMVQNGVSGRNSCLYRGPHPTWMSYPWLNFLQQPITIQYSPSMIDFLCTGVQLRVQIKGKSPAGTSCWYSAHAAARRNLVESSEMM